MSRQQAPLNAPVHTESYQALLRYAGCLHPLPSCQKIYGQPLRPVPPGHKNMVESGR